VRNPRGFTLVELLIAVGLVGVIFLGLGSFFLSGLRFHEDATLQADMQRQGGLVLEAMGAQIRRATTWTLTPCGGMATALRIANADGPYCFYQGLDATVSPPRPGQLMEAPPVGTAHSLLKGARFPLTASALTFRFCRHVAGDNCELGGPSSEHVRITFTLAGGPTVFPSTFALTVKRRN
jgi:prepilin-type N-terminal cleavage/methylation domain-containing protein